MMNEKLSSILSSKLETIGPNETLGRVRDILKTYRVHHIPVVDDGGILIGLVTTYDLFKQEKCVEDYSSMLVKEIMTTKLAVLGPNDKVGSAAELFLEHMFQAVPIVDDNRKLLGIVTMFDIVRYEFDKEYDH